MSPQDKVSVKTSTVAVFATVLGLVAGFALRTWEYGSRTGRQSQQVEYLLTSRNDHELRLRAVETAVIKLSNLETLLSRNQ